MLACLKLKASLVLIFTDYTWQARGETEVELSDDAAI